MRPLRLTLLHKLILTNVGVILALVVVLLVLFLMFNRAWVGRIFDDTQSDILESLSKELGQYYARNEGWSDLKTRPDVLLGMARRAIARAPINKILPLIRGPAGRDGHRPRAFPLHSEHDPASPPPPLDPRLPPKHAVVRYFVHKIALYDANIGVRV